jgi:DNA repair photolyase
MCSMRWDNLTLTAEEAARLPGYRDDAVVRRFDAPEALDMRFYEVHARSVLNRVPPQSRMPFRWTINPYRGCSHACIYCLDGETPILMGDGSTRRLADLRVGDSIYGTRVEGRYRRYVRTEVQAHWSTIKPAYRVTLADGTELIASGDHRFLTNRGWKHVMPAARGEGQRPYLTTNDRLLGVGQFAAGPAEDDDYRRGYACGMVRGDGSLGVYDYERPGRSHGVPFVTEPPRENGVRAIRVTGGLARRLRFFHLVDPAIVRKRELDGVALKAAGDRRVASVEPLGLAMRLYDITTGTGDFIANGVVSHNCFARPTHRYLDFGPGRDFEREIVVKVNTPEVLRVELGRRSWGGEHVALGTNTDPYQWVEGRYKLMPGIWEAMRDARNPCSVLTKSPLLLRDLPIMRELAAVTDFTASLSIPTLDEKAWRATEPHTPHPRARLEAVAELNRNGIPTGVLIAPLMPGINDGPEQVEPLLAAAEEAGAVSIGGIALHLRGDVRGVFMDWLRGARPDLVERYEQLYARGAYAPRAERARLSALVRGRGARPSRWRLRPPPDPRPVETAARPVARLARNGVQQALF